MSWNWTDLNALLACPACQFDPNSKVTVAAVLAIGFMLLIVFGVMGSLVAFIMKMARAERLASQDPQP